MLCVCVHACVRLCVRQPQEKQWSRKREFKAMSSADNARVGGPSHKQLLLKATRGIC